jgi:hypothetical protein
VVISSGLTPIFDVWVSAVDRGWMNGIGYWVWLTAMAIFSTVSPFLALYLVVEEDMVAEGLFGLEETAL